MGSLSGSFHCTGITSTSAKSCEMKNVNEQKWHIMWAYVSPSFLWGDWHIVVFDFCYWIELALLYLFLRCVHCTLRICFAAPICNLVGIMKHSSLHNKPSLRNKIANEMSDIFGRGWWSKLSIKGKTLHELKIQVHTVMCTCSRRKTSVGGRYVAFVRGGLEFCRDNFFASIPKLNWNVKMRLKLCCTYQFVSWSPLIISIQKVLNLSLSITLLQFVTAHVQHVSIPGKIP